MRLVSAWVEVNVEPVDERDPERLLLDVVDPLVHGKLGEHIATWFYFWEPALRLRLCWRDPAESSAHRAELAWFLDEARHGGKLREWYEGSHGKRGETYTGEADFYGERLWELTSKDWMSGSELALAIAKLDRDGTLERPRSFHWQRRVHLFSNQLSADEIRLCLRQASGYIGLFYGDDPRFADVTRAIEELLRQ
jgi:Lantibiotic biosynthesis dehydratase C-term